MYCSGTCKARMHKRKKADRLKVKISLPARGEAFEAISDAGLVDDLLDKRISHSEAARRLGFNASTISRAVAGHQEEELRKISAADFSLSDRYRAMLGPPEWEGDPAGEAFETFLDLMVLAFVRFRTEFFMASRNSPYLTEDFHREWIKEVLRSIYTGGKLLILSPPRHGKSELLVHFCVWLIIRNPDIRIMWVSGNGEIASDMVGSVRQHLEDNTELVEAFLPKGKTFKPQGRTGHAWRNTGFRVANRTVVGQKAPTMVAVGRGGKILSRDCDFIITDDIEDHESTLQPSARASTRSWFTTTLDSRKEEHTGWVAIGSRQHPDDVYGYLLEDPEWRTIVNAAHDPGCLKDPEDESIHRDCMLFPQLRTYPWLKAKRTSATALGLEGHFEMVYLNAPRPDGVALFTRDQIARTYNPSRPLGLSGVPSPHRLVAGLDPSATGYQAGFLVAYHADSAIQYVVDLDNRLGGGIEEALSLFRAWLSEYGVKHWVIEENGFQRAIRQDPRVRDWAATNMVTLEGHQTQGQNKHDPLFGVGAMARLFDEGTIDLPYGSSAAKAKIETYTRQLLHFTDDHRRQRNNKMASDLLMASWFPQKVVRRWSKEFQAEMSVDYDPSYGSWDMSEIDNVPW